MTVDQHSDQELLCAWRGGDHAAFAVLVARYEGALLGHARALLGPRAAPEDAVQETFLRLARNPPSISADGALPKTSRESAMLLAWLHRVTRNLCMDILRTETRRRAREQEMALPEAVVPSDSIAARDTRAAVERSLDHLPQGQREVLVLRLLSDRSYREIAEITDRKIGTVGWLVSEGLKALAKELAPLLGLEGAPIACPSATGKQVRETTPGGTR